MQLITFSERVRPTAHVPFEELERRAIVHKQYSTDRCRLFTNDFRYITSVARQQASALAALKAIDEGLYKAAVEVRWLHIIIYALNAHFFYFAC